MRVPAVPVSGSVDSSWMTTERAPGLGTNGTRATAYPVPSSSTVKSSQTSVRSLTFFGSAFETL